MVLTLQHIGIVWNCGRIVHLSLSLYSRMYLSPFFSRFPRVQTNTLITSGIVHKALVYTTFCLSLPSGTVEVNRQIPLLLNFGLKYRQYPTAFIPFSYMIICYVLLLI